MRIRRRQKDHLGASWSIRRFPRLRAGRLCTGVPGYPQGYPHVVWKTRAGLRTNAARTATGGIKKISPAPSERGWRVAGQAVDRGPDTGGPETAGAETGGEEGS